MKKISIAVGLLAGVIGLSACSPGSQTTTTPNNGIAYPTASATSSRTNNPSIPAWWAGVQPYHHEIGEILEAIGEFSSEGNVSLVKSSCVVLQDQIRQASAHVRPAPDAIVTSVVVPYEQALYHFSAASGACLRGSWSTMSSELRSGTAYIEQATAGVTAYTTRSNS